jgi:integrase
MPRRAKGARLYLDPTRKEWVIRDGGRFIRTGRRKGDRGNAEKDLGEYIGRKHQPTPSASPFIDDVLTAYGQEHGPHTSRPKELAQQIETLLAFWSGKRVDEITSRSCRGFAHEGSRSSARRNLETLRAAVRYWHREYGPLTTIPAFTLPPKPEPRERWLTTDEARRFRRAAMPWPWLYRFVVIGLLTGSRSGPIRALRWEWIDFEAGTMLRREPGKAESKTKRTPPVKIARRLVRLLRLWRRADMRAWGGKPPPYVIHYKGKPVGRFEKTWDLACEAAGLVDVTPHTLRHTRATWLMQAGVPLWEAAGALGMTTAMLERQYAKHHPNWQREAAEV